MAGITKNRLEQMEKAWVLLEEGHSRKDVAEMLNVSLPWMSKAVAEGKKQGRLVETTKVVNLDDYTMFNIAIPMTVGEKEDLLKKYDPIKLQHKVREAFYRVLAGDDDLFQKGYDAGFDEADGRTAAREARIDALLNAPIKTPEERAAETKEVREAMEQQLAEMVEGWSDENSDEPSAGRGAKEKPQIPDTCGSCGSRELVVFEEDRLYQCDRCLHEDNY